MSNNIFYKTFKVISHLTLGCMIFVSGSALAENKIAETKKPEASDNQELFNTVLKSRVSRYKKYLANLAANPLLVAVVREANKKSFSDHISNSEWKLLAEDDPKVLRLNKNETGEMLAKFEKSLAFEKLNVRDAKGYLAAFSSDNTKPLVYNAASRPGFENGLKGLWSASEIKPDPTTGKMAVQIAAPIMDEGKVIGVVHSSVTAE